MKKLTAIAFLALIAWAFVPVSGFSSNGPPLEERIEGLDARQALTLANQWHWERRPVKTYITSEEVVFQFKNGEKKKIALPEKEMMVAIAPYIDRTHA